MKSIEGKESILILIFAMVGFASGSDLVADSYHGANTEHIVKEAVIIILSLSAIAWLLYDLRERRLQISSLKQELEAISSTQATPKTYVLEGRRTLGNVVSQQFEEWNLTDSEREVGWLLLKGLSLKEISIVRNTKEKTVRQQASSIYSKAGIDGRHAFSAWFIEDIL